MSSLEWMIIRSLLEYFFLARRQLDVIAKVDGDDIAEQCGFRIMSVEIWCGFTLKLVQITFVIYCTQTLPQAGEHTWKLAIRMFFVLAGAVCGVLDKEVLQVGVG
ncbi:MAG: hypothetical protein C0433_12390 [Cyclobacterium sp.]|nr:hypothetical protein [Cyclobacterium sp.]